MYKKKGKRHKDASPTRISLRMVENSPEKTTFFSEKKLLNFTQFHFLLLLLSGGKQTEMSWYFHSLKLKEEDLISDQ